MYFATICGNIIGMKKRFNYVHKRSFIILAAFLVIILLVGIIVNIIELVTYEKSVLFTILPIFGIVFMAAMLVLLVLMVFNTHYTLTDYGFKQTIGFIFSKKLYNDLLLLREHPDKKMLLMYFKRKIKGEYFIEHIVINIKPQDYNDFINAVRSKNSDVQYELYIEYKPDENEGE